MLAKILDMGPLRNMLHVLALAWIAVLPFSEPARILEGWQLFFGGIVPAMAPLIFIVMMFDVMMCSILKGETDDAGRARYRLITRTHLVLGVILITLWIYSFESLLFG